LSERVFISTLGSEPQVVTLALWLLRAGGVVCRRAVVVHTDTSVPAIGNAVSALQVIASHPPLADVTFEFYPILHGDHPIRDICTQEEAHATFRTIFQLVQREKRAGREIHFSIAGGRKVMAIYGMVVAQLLFDSDDRLYHLLSEEPLLHERRLFPSPSDDVKLVPVPVLRWQEGEHILGNILAHEDPLEAVRSRAWKEARRRDALRHFVEEALSPAERTVLELVVREGLSNAAIAERLHLSPKTVANHLTRVYDKWRSAMGEPADKRVERLTLIRALVGYFGSGEEK